MIRALDESWWWKSKEEEGRRGYGVRGGEIRTNGDRNGWRGWRKGWLVSHAPRGRGENRFSLSAARIMAGEGRREAPPPSRRRIEGLLHGNSIPWYEFSLVTLKREISPPPARHPSSSPTAKRPCHFSYPPPPSISASCESRLAHLWRSFWGWKNEGRAKFSKERKIWKGFGTKVFTFE